MASKQTVATVTLNIQAKMDDLESQLRKYRDLMEKIKPDSSSYKALSKELTRLERNFLNIQRESKETFSSPAQLKSFEAHLKKLGYSVEDLGSSFRGVKFSDLIFNDGDLDKLEDMRKELSKTFTKLKSFEKDAVKDFANKDGNSDFLKKVLGINPEKVAKDFDGFSDLLERKQNELETKLASSMGASSNKKKTFDDLGVLYEDLENKALSLFDTKNTKFYNKRGGAKNDKGQEFVKELLSFDIDPSLMKELEGKNLSQILKYKKQIEDAILSKLMSVSDERETARGPMEQADKAVAEAKANLNTLKQLSNEFNSFSTNQKTSTELNNLEDTVKRLRVSISQEISKLFNTAIPQQDLDTLTNDVVKSLSGIVQEADVAGDRLEKAFDVNTTSESIKGAIKNWFGFFEVINMGKRILSGMGNDIRELDKVITEITIVTDMGHDELWGSISTYSDIAKQYGSTIAGVYEVSMLYYQQGLDTNEVMAATEETLKMARIAGIDYATATDYELKSYVA